MSIVTANLELPPAGAAGTERLPQAGFRNTDVFSETHLPRADNEAEEWL